MIISNEADLRSLMDEYGTEILRLCYLMLKDYQLAEDAAQDTFLKVYSKYSSFHGGSSVKTWITAIAMNVCRDMMRRKTYRERPLELPEEDDGSFTDTLLRDDSPTPEERAVTEDEKTRLLKAVGELPEIYRSTILMYYYSELGVDEISKALKCAKPTVNVRLKRGRDMLREALSYDRKA